jgi:hypothetical protein
LEQEPSERGDPGATPRRDHGLPFHHPYFRFGESTWRISADALGLALLMMRTPYTRIFDAKNRTICLFYICLLSHLVFYLFLTVLWRTSSNICAV